MTRSVHAAPRDLDPDAIPIGAIVRTPEGRIAKVTGRTGKPRGGGRTDPFPRLICRYVDARGERGATVWLQPKVVEVLRNG